MATQRASRGSFAAPAPVLCPLLDHFCAALISKNLETPSATKLIMGIKTQFNPPLKACPPLKHFAQILDSNKSSFESPSHHLRVEQH